MLSLKAIFVFIMLILFTFSACSDQKNINQHSKKDVKRYVLAGEKVFPEGVAYQASNGDFFVSSTGDGTIYKGNVNALDTVVFLKGTTDGRTTAVGMKVDLKGRLFVSGGSTGSIFIYDVTTKKLLAKFIVSAKNTFINDVIIAPNGDAFFTDSINTQIYKVSSSFTENSGFSVWLDLKDSVIKYDKGFNLNGIAITEDGQYLITVQTNTGKLFRIHTATKAVQEIQLSGEPLSYGDGIYLEGKTLYVLRNSKFSLAIVKLNEDFTKAELVSEVKNPAFDLPTTLARAGNNFLVVNSQFHRRGEGKKPILPFVVISIPIPTEQ